MIKVCVLVSGGGTNLQAIIDAIDSKKITNTKIECVISNKKNAYALERAANNNIRSMYITPSDYDNRDEFNKELINQIDIIAPDLIVLAGFLVVLPKELVDKYPNKIINIHPSLIPSFCGKGYYGLKVHEEALKRGVKVTGATVHFVDSGTDTGPIIFQKTVDVIEDDTPETLQKRVMKEAEWIIMPKAIDYIANGKIEVKDGKVKVIEN